MLATTGCSMVRIGPIYKDVWYYTMLSMEHTIEIEGLQ